MITAREIQKWNPMTLEEVVGNEQMVAHYRQCLRNEGQMLNTLNTGESRSGKGGTVTAFVRSLICERRPPGAILACGRCKTCQSQACIQGERGNFAQARPSNDRDPVHYVMVDCTSVTEAELRELFDELRYYQDLTVVVLDEVHRLQRRGLDEMLLKPMENSGIVWIANAVSVVGLERMFLNRFGVKLKTSLPSVDSLSLFLASRCLDWKIEWDHESTVVELSKRSNLITGKALQVLGRAVLNNRQLTAGLVEEHLFDEDDS